MKITVFAAGSRGDIQPCVALSMGLQQAGYRVSLAAPQDFAGFVQEHGITFRPLRGDVQKIMASDSGRNFMETGGTNPLRSILAIRKLIRPVVMEMAADAYAACQEAEAIICLGVFSAFGKSIAEALKIPLIHIEPTPLLPTRAFPAPSWPVQRSLGGAHNYFSGMAMLQVIWQWHRPFVNMFRAQLGLPAYRFAKFVQGLRSVPMLSAYSPALIPHPPDWPDSVQITGYLFLEAQPGWRPSRELEAFLEAGEPPVCIGFGSMSGQKAQALTSLVIEAITKSDQRGVLLTGWGGLRVDKAPENVFVVESAPHRWLFPRMAAVVHHGGAGTTAEGLRAGVPTVIVPFIFDQYFWGARIKAMGLGPQPIPQKNLSAECLAQAIWTAVTDTAMRQRARSCGMAIRSEDGLANAIQTVQQYLGEPKDRVQKGS